jgi:hypothetical protein
MALYEWSLVGSTRALRCTRHAAYMYAHRSIFSSPYRPMKLECQVQVNTYDDQVYNAVPQKLISNDLKFVGAMFL